MTQPPALPDQSARRTLIRVVGVVLLVGGLGLAAYGFATFVGGMSADSIDESGSGRSLLLFGGGAFAAVVGFGFANLGFMGAAARYGAGETMPVLRDSAAYLTDGQGLLGVGRTVDDPLPAERSGPSCGRCGLRNGAGARFCNACGSALG